MTKNNHVTSTKSGKKEISLEWNSIIIMWVLWFSVREQIFNSAASALNFLNKHMAERW